MAPERGKAFGIYAGIAGTGGAIGPLLGGAQTEALDWRWCLYGSLPFAISAAIAGTRLLHHVPAPARPRIDLPGTPTASSGPFALVSAWPRGESTAGAISSPSAPDRRRRPARLRRPRAGRRPPAAAAGVDADRNRGAAFPAIGTASAGLFGLFLLLTCYLQDTKDLTALETGSRFCR